MGSIRFVVWGLVFIGLAATSQAQTFSFECITHNDENNCDLGEATLSVEVGDADIGNPGPPEEDDERVLMIFRNVPLDERHMPTGPVVEAIYIEDPGGYLSSLNPIDSDDVSFSGDPTPRNLPGGSTLVPPFSATRSLSADADPPAATNGVGPTEELTLVYYGDFDDVSPQLSSGIRIGIHVISFENGGSESFILVPESGARCGDGEVTPDEECDDGDDDDNDGCRSDCTLQYCGDGILDEGEECDDGNGDDDDCCDDCEIEDDNDPDDDDGCRDDGNPCTDDVCTAGICTHPNNTSSCNDGDACDELRRWERLHRGLVRRGRRLPALAPPGLRSVQRARRLRQRQRLRRCGGLHRRPVSEWGPPQLRRRRGVHDGFVPPDLWMRLREPDRLLQR
jgi:cysteine-rich repeat protein